MAKTNDGRFVKMCSGDCSYAFIAPKIWDIRDHSQDKCPLCNSKLYDPNKFRKDKDGKIVKR